MKLTLGWLPLASLQASCNLSKVFGFFTLLGILFYVQLRVPYSKKTDDYIIITVSDRDKQVQTTERVLLLPERGSISLNSGEVTTKRKKP